MPFYDAFAPGPRALATGSQALILGTTVGYVLNAPRVPVKFSLYVYHQHFRLVDDLQ
jgi:hypothetical protein